MHGLQAAVSKRCPHKSAHVALTSIAYVALTSMTITYHLELHLDGETTMWIMTASEQDCCQLNQRYTTCYMDQPHNCNEQLPTVYQPRTDVMGLSDMWETKKRKRYAEESSMDHDRRRWAGVGSHTFNLADEGCYVL